MPSFNSKNGVWEPAKERAFDPKTGEIYDGPDREALKYIKQEGTVGMNVIDDPQIIEIAENRRMTVEQYVEKFSPKPEQIKVQKEAQNKVITHSDPVGKPGVQGPTKGGFYDQSKDSPESALAKKG